MVNLLREMWEDSRRHRDDAQVNNRMADVVGERGSMIKKAWKDLRVGDIVKVNP